tara:strand:+ start:89 stop:499 length:411 start_codon:yes stop_codon:yes gene_type:complete
MEFITDTNDKLDIDVSLYGLEHFLRVNKAKWTDCEIDTYTAYAKIHWEFYIEERKWGIKDFGVYATKIELEVDIDCFVGKSDNNRTQTQSFDLTNDIKDFEITTEHYPKSSAENKTSFAIEDVTIDFDNKTITIYF